jgi:hypothetical protein
MMPSITVLAQTATQVPSISAHPDGTTREDPNGGSWFVAALDPGASKSFGLRLLNPADVEQSVRLYLSDVQFDDRGQPQVTDTTTDVGAWGAFDREQVTIPPRQTAIETFSVTAPTNADPGDHVGAVVVEHSPQGGGQLPTINRVALRLYVTLPGDARREFTIDTVSAQKDSWFFPREMTVKANLRNTGRVRLEPQVNVNDAPAKGPQLLLTQAVEEYVTTRSVPFWGGPLRLRVDATTSSLGIAGPQRQARVTVWVIPWHLFILILAVGAIVYLARRYLRNRKDKYSDIQADIRRIERLVSQQMRQTGGTNAVSERTDAEAAIRAAIKQARRAGDSATVERLELALHGVGGSRNGAHHPAPQGSRPTPPSNGSASPYAEAPPDVVPPSPWTS